jgi:hypothetical protein
MRQSKFNHVVGRAKGISLKSPALGPFNVDTFRQDSIPQKVPSCLKAAIPFPTATHFSSPRYKKMDKRGSVYFIEMYPFPKAPD